MSKRLYHNSIKWAMFLSVVMFAYFVFAVFIDGHYMRKPFTSEGGHLNVDKDVYSLGETVYARRSFCKTRDVVGVVQWSLVDGYLTIYPKKEGNLPQGCYDLTFAIEKIPEIEHLKGHTVHFEGVTTYKINGLNTVTETYRTEDFKIE